MIVKHPTRDGWLIATPEVIELLNAEHQLALPDGQFVHPLYFYESDITTLEQAKNYAVLEVNQQASAQYEIWQSAYASYGDHLAILQAIETSLRAIRRDALDAVEAAVTVEEIEAVLAGLTWPPVPGQAEIEADVGPSSTAKQEARQFLQENPNARLLLALPPAELETAIEDRTAGGETLLLKTLAFGIRYLNELIR